MLLWTKMDQQKTDEVYDLIVKQYAIGKIVLFLTSMLVVVLEVKFSTRWVNSYVFVCMQSI
jgi:hypothetical protein